MYDFTSTSASSRYEKLSLQRQPYLDRARDCSKLTIPHLLPDEGHTGSSKLYTPFQSIGSRSITGLSSKLLMALFPPNSPFFRLMVDPYKLDQVTGDPAVRTEIDVTLNSMEQAVMTEIETRNYRPYIHEALKQLIVSGNVLINLPEKTGEMKVFKLDRFVVKRDPEGSLQLIIIKESIAPALLPDYLRNEYEEVNETKLEDTTDVYTVIHRSVDNPGEFEVWQEALGNRIEETVGTYKKDQLPWLPLRMEVVTGESYGYGYAVQYLGDLKSLEGLTQAMVEAAAVAAKCLFLVDPASQTRARTLAESPNGAIREGRADDVTVVNMGGKAADMRITYEAIGQIRDRLQFAFLLHQGIQRQGERVTATEWRVLVEELENVLAGQYALLSAEFQLPLVQLLMSRMTKEKRLPKIPKDLVRPSIVTGIEALGRGHDLQRLDAFVQGAIQTLGPDIISQFMDVRDYLDRRANALGLVSEGLIKDEATVAAEQQAAQMAAMAEKLGPAAIGGMSKQAVEAEKNG